MFKILSRSGANFLRNKHSRVKCAEAYAHAVKVSLDAAISYADASKAFTDAEAAYVDAVANHA